MANALAHQGTRAGSASALLGALQFGIATLSSTLVGLMGGGSAVPMATVIASCGLLAYLAHRIWITPLLADLQPAKGKENF
jgi:DHA1 family bicyclomycin/chloramphenicol resistance-like MFS transporter